MIESRRMAERSISPAVSRPTNPIAHATETLMNLMIPASTSPRVTSAAVPRSPSKLMLASLSVESDVYLFADEYKRQCVMSKMSVERYCTTISLSSVHVL